ncbi:hypothetical protein JYU04_03895, partial [Dehalococcoides mccartyi]|nr:hypothetical protein [Dehalococcoides mccartyi]
MERLLEHSLDDQYALERKRKAYEDALNRRLKWSMLPLGIAFAIVALYIDISTRVAIPVLIDLKDQVTVLGQRADYDVFRLYVPAFARLLPAAVIAGLIASWVAVWAGTFYRRSIIASMYALIGLIYAGVLTAALGLLIPLNVLILDVLNKPIIDSEIPHASDVSLLQPEIVGIAPLSYV